MRLIAMKKQKTKALFQRIAKVSLPEITELSSPQQVYIGLYLS